jgi:hypothetical protein
MKVKLKWTLPQQGKIDPHLFCQRITAKTDSLSKGVRELSRGKMAEGFCQKCILTLY